MSEYDTYRTLIKAVEETHELAPYAKRSLEEFSESLIGEIDIRDYLEGSTYGQHEQNPVRTPLQRERDRIVHSPQFRKLTEKYHIIYYQDQKLVRNYITHVMRAAQVSRSIARQLRLNQDFAEAISLGAKVGCIPFPHIAKEIIPNWATDKLQDFMKKGEDKNLPVTSQSTLPTWLDQYPEEMQSDVLSSVPIAKLNNKDDPFYSTGKQSYWNFCTRGYVSKPSESLWQKETMYGIWRHSLLHRDFSESDAGFEFNFEIGGQKHSLSWKHDTYEAIVVRYADDITWVIENLHDANQASAQSSSEGRGTVLEQLSQLEEFSPKKIRQFNHQNGRQNIADILKDALSEKDTSGLYNYFITDLISYSTVQLHETDSDLLKDRQGLRNGTGRQIILPSGEAFEVLNIMKTFLTDEIFSDRRTDNRNSLLRTILRFVAEILYGNHREPLPALTEKLIRVRTMHPPYLNIIDVLKNAQMNPVFRIQLVITLMSEMSDLEMFDIVGVSAL